jgi:uncharacterized membrane protein
MPEEPGTEDRAPAGYTPERISFFTDAIFAIAMTLLVFDIPRPEGPKFSVGDGQTKAEAFHHLAHFLGSQWDAFYAYFLTFLIIWIVWRQHHRMFDQFRRMTSRMVAWHFPLLLFAAFLPYASTTYGHYSDNPMAALLYGLVVAALLFSRTVIQAEALRGNVLIESADREDYRVEVLVSRISTGYWVLTLALVWWTPWAGIPWLFSSAGASVVRAVLRRRRRPVSPA